MADAPILGLEHIVFGYAGRPILFTDINFSLWPQEHIGLYGANGSGKTTLLRLFTGLEKPHTGNILFYGAPVLDSKDWHNLRCDIGFVLQDSEDQLFMPTVLEEVAFGPLNLGLKKKEAKERALETLVSMGMEDYAIRQTHRLSGGEKKLIALASVLSMRPKALLLDEPTAFLDDEARDRIVSILQQQEIARITVSHDKDFLREVSQSLVYLRGGCIYTE